MNIVTTFLRDKRFSLCVAALLLAFCQSGFAADEIELHIPLRDGAYSIHDLYRETNSKLGTRHDLCQIPDRRVELSRLERVAIRLAKEAGVFDASIEETELILVIADTEADAVRRKRLQRIGRLLGISLTEWPPELGLHVPPHVDPEARTVLLIHGLESGLSDLKRMKQAFDDCGVQTLTFDYPNDGPIAWSGDRLSDELQGLQSKHPALRVAIVGHSMGGLVARYALETPGRNPACVRDLFMLGTPNHGSQAAVAQDWLELLFAAKRGGIFDDDLLLDGLGEAAVDLRPGSRFLKNLNKRAKPAGVRYHVGIGRKSLVDRRVREELETYLTVAADRGEGSDTLRLRLLAFLKSPEFQDGQGDGAVSVSSARLRGAATYHSFEKDHLELLSLPGKRPGDNEVFQWMVDTLGWQREE